MFEIKRNEDMQEENSLEDFLKAQGYKIIRRTDIGHVLMEILGNPKSETEKDFSDIMKRHPIDMISLMAAVGLIEKRLFSDVAEVKDDSD